MDADDMTQRAGAVVTRLFQRARQPPARRGCSREVRKQHLTQCRKALETQRARRAHDGGVAGAGQLRDLGGGPQQHRLLLADEEARHPLLGGWQAFDRGKDARIEIRGLIRECGVGHPECPSKSSVAIATVRTIRNVYYRLVTAEAGLASRGAPYP